MAGYLVQDYRFLDTFLALIGGAIAKLILSRVACAWRSLPARLRAMRHLLPALF